MLFESYFDESGSDDNSPVLCVAGYVFSNDQAKHLDREWRGVLEAHALRYFRMSECAHGSGIFRDMSKDERTTVATKMIQIIKRRAERGFAVTVDEAEYRMVTSAAPPSSKPLFGDAYSWCVHACIAGVGSWINYHRVSVTTSFFFESGHKSQTAANRTMNLLFDSPLAKAQYGYVTHSFIEKTSFSPIQAADILAWQWAKDYKRRLQGKSRRMDLEELLKAPHWTLHWSSDMLKNFQSMFAPAAWLDVAFRSAF